jgi:hypothetical protein
MNKKPSLVLDPEQRSAAVEATKQMKALFPSMFMGLNTAQYRALEDMYAPVDESGRLPDLNSVEFANGVGKSHLMILDIVGWTMGTDYLDRAAFPEAAIKYWDDMIERRDSGKMALRLVCTADDMKAGGSVHNLLKEILPWAKPTKQDNSGCFRQIDIPHPELPFITNHIAVKTFDQPEDKHSGTTCDRIWSNENLPEEIWGETWARTRGGGSIAMFATILDYASYLDELEGAVKFVMRRSKGHLYENCKGRQVTDEMAAEVFDEIGTMLQKDPEGGYFTGGVLNRTKIEALVEGWARTCPHQLRARKTGRPITSGGKIHPSYSEAVHVKKNEYLKVVPANYPVVQIVDPHPARPDACLWGIVLPTNRLHIFGEWPTYEGFGYYEAIKEKRFTVTQKCDIWRNMENEFGVTVSARVGDPNRFKEPNADNFAQLSSMYALHGFDFDLSVNDNFELGLERVNEYLYYDQLLFKMHPDDPAALPRLTISERCTNCRRALMNFGRKVPRNRTDPISDKVDERYSCFAGCVRYFVMWHSNNSFDDIAPDAGRSTDYEAVIKGREPKAYREKKPAFNSHGRTPMDKYR